MFGFMLDERGDLVIRDSEIQEVADKDLLVQSVRQVLLTNFGEWWLNSEEGIDRHCVLAFHPNVEQIKDNIRLGLLQVDKTFKITDFSYEMKGSRNLEISFSAVNENGDKISLSL